MSKTMNELKQVYLDAWCAAKGDAISAGIAAVVRALRDEIVEDGNCKYCVATTAMYNEILGDAGNDAARKAYWDKHYGVDETSTPATDPAPAVCEWTRDVQFRDAYYTKCSVVLQGRNVPSDCPSCGKPIKFTEKKT